MSDKPEPLAAILAEMRAAAKSTDLFNGEEVGEPLIRGTKVEEWADRLEAAAERDARAREQSAADYALKRGEDIHADRCRNCTERAPGNAAALREALENARSKFIHIKKCADEGEVSRKKLTILCEFVSQEIAAALAAPARNVDRFATAAEAALAFNADTKTKCGEEISPRLLAWLFATAEGGAE